jgi:hypothetical protein
LNAFRKLIFLFLILSKKKTPSIFSNSTTPAKASTQQAVLKQAARVNLKHMPNQHLLKQVVKTTLITLVNIQHIAAIIQVLKKLKQLTKM